MDNAPGDNSRVPARRFLETAMKSGDDMLFFTGNGFHRPYPDMHTCYICAAFVAYIIRMRFSLIIAHPLIAQCTNILRSETYAFESELISLLVRKR
jgi:hypothetical protein